ncbi:MAG: Gfo/Idh/MocA family oxidoreductase [Phycisphaerales bacterium]|nr:Gfo/Idh/MocA family oxidoreductase [Phycisphaerales bacterium]
MPGAPPVRVGIIGLGFMGRTHLAAYRSANEAGHACRVVAVADPDPRRRAGEAAVAGNIETGGTSERLFDPAEVRAYERAEDLLADPHVDHVSICTPTDTHVPLALAAIAAGRHALVEKPLALRSADARRIADAASKARTLCTPAMCMRFWPAWAWIKRAIDSGEFGRVTSATFHRLGSRPEWTDFYADDARSGGAIIDLHMHDADFIRWCFGPPRDVVSTGSTHHLTTIYHYDHVPQVVAEGGWGHQPGFGFRVRCVVCFERATADFDLARTPQFLLHRGAESLAPDVGPLTGYEVQARAMVDAVARGGPSPVPLEDAVAALELLEKERRALKWVSGAEQPEL